MLGIIVAPFLVYAAAYYGWNEKKMGKGQQGMLICSLCALVAIGVTLTFFSLPRSEHIWAVWPMALYAVVVYPAMFISRFVKKRDAHA